MNTLDYVPDIWYMIAGRIAPPICCTNPTPFHRAFSMAMIEVSKKDGDLDRAVSLLQEIIASVPPEWMVFEQAGQLLNVIGWRTQYHKEWFPPDRKVRSFKPGVCGPHVAHAYALMQTGADDDALHLVSRIIHEGVPGSDDIYMASLIRTAIYICQGRIDMGEEELRLIHQT
ncbi:hypothetical protein KSK55_06325 [Methanospirillum purgamenti]|jgi:hypothetical protein|uniref:Tetratricopeptide repeat protein n=1 Tax=Methanospirillum hungatei TaxID=2203 RepID=A0A8F5VQH2_METHU|nr:hypothetical protein [Methanospirillum hungatei]QXO95992.1 hypothetical protein KSK55_06325 [Methanospirillum hungatei]